jgi:hypothetical protein
VIHKKQGGVISKTLQPRGIMIILLQDGAKISMFAVVAN